jgi:hypothetical protein
MLVFLIAIPDNCHDKMMSGVISLILEFIKIWFLTD